MGKKKTAGNMVFSTIIVMVGLLFTKGSGFLRDILVGIKFDENLYRDAFTLAFTIPDLFYNLLVGGAIFSTVAENNLKKPYVTIHSQIYKMSDLSPEPYLIR